MSWSNRFIGIPYLEFGRARVGADCWGLACVIYREDLGINLPDYLGYGSVDEHAEIAALIDGAEASPLWQPVADPAPYDIAVFRRGRMATHLGIVIRPGLMIHMDHEDCAKVSNYRDGRWGNRFKGHYRHVERVFP